MLDATIQITLARAYPPVDKTRHAQTTEKKFSTMAY